MRSDAARTVSAAAIAIAAVACAGLLAAFAADADDPECSDYGDKWSMTCRFVYTGAGAETVLWEFGDGESAEGFAVDHTYAAVGEYFVRQTATNSAGSAVACYRINICGFPTVTIDLGYGEPATSAQPAFNVPAVLADPSREGFAFGGWYTDPAFLNPYGGEGVVRPITVYAKWIDPSSPAHTVTVAEPSGEVVASVSVSHGGKLSYEAVAGMLVHGGRVLGGLFLDPDLKTRYDFSPVTSDITLYAKYAEPQDSPALVAGALLLAAAIALIAGILLRRPIAVIAAAALIAIGACVWFGVLGW